MVKCTDSIYLQNPEYLRAILWHQTWTSTNHSSFASLPPANANCDCTKLNWRPPKTPSDQALPGKTGVNQPTLTVAPTTTKHRNGTTLLNLQQENNRRSQPTTQLNSTQRFANFTQAELPAHRNPTAPSRPI